MIITENKIKVTQGMLDKANMTNFGKIGVPDGGSLIWKSYFDLTKEDFDKIEEYFIKKQNEN